LRRDHDECGTRYDASGHRDRRIERHWIGYNPSAFEHGYRVVANSRTISKSADLKPSAELVLVDGNIGKKETAIKVAEAAMRHFDRIDLLVNNAGILCF
jgi:hypothetical protein